MAQAKVRRLWRMRVGAAQAFALRATFLCAIPLCAALPHAAAQQSADTQGSANTTISGELLDAAGKLVSGAVVTLDAASRTTPLRTTTDSGGRFTFSHLRPRTYAVHAEKSGLRSPSRTFDCEHEPVCKVVLVLGTTGAPPAVAQAMEFSDDPNFTVAGVTDWTAVGGHGSDATLRTSEDLARQTRALKAPDTATTTPDNSAERQLRDALNVAPQSYTANHDLGAYYFRTAQYRKAVPLLKKASEVSGAKPEDEYQVALACRGVGDPGEARQHLQRALAQQDRADYHRVFAEVEEQLGDPLASVREAARATQLEPSEENYFTWGSELLLHRAVWQAVEVFGNGAKTHPASARLKTAWGSALFAGGLYDEAARRLCEASDLNPADREPYLFMGKAALASPSPLPGVEQRLARFATVQPNLPEANYLYAMALSRRTTEPKPQQVEALLARAVALNPGYADAYLQLGILSFAQHRYPEAIRSYQRAIAADPKQAEAHYRLAVAYDRTGEAAKATQERQLHDTIEKVDADDVEQKRREVKQFVVSLQGQPSSTTP